MHPPRFTWLHSYAACLNQDANDAIVKTKDGELIVH